MNAIVVYRSKYGSTKKYAEWIAEELGIECRDAKGMKVSELLPYDTIILGGGLYAEVIAGATLITKNFDMLRDKKLIIYTTGLTPIDCRDYYDKLVIVVVSFERVLTNDFGRKRAVAHKRGHTDDKLATGTVERCI
jgi:hypothetical protein